MVFGNNLDRYLEIMPNLVEETKDSADRLLYELKRIDEFIQDGEDIISGLHSTSMAKEITIYMDYVSVLCQKLSELKKQSIIERDVLNQPIVYAPPEAYGIFRD